MRKIDIDTLSRRPLEALHADGINELVTGITWLLTGLLLGLPFLVPKGSWWNTYWIIVPALLAMSGFIAQWAIKRLKERWSYRRAGYVEAMKPTAGRLRAVVFAAAITAAVIAAFLSSGKGWLNLLPLASSILAGAVLVCGMRKSGSPLAWVYGAISVALGAAVTLARLEIEYAFPVLWGGLGIAIAFGGTLRLVRFLRTHREVQEDVSL
jgi:hypothetical protein